MKRIIRGLFQLSVMLIILLFINVCGKAVKGGSKPRTAVPAGAASLEEDGDEEGYKPADVSSSTTGDLDDKIKEKKELRLDKRKMDKESIAVETADLPAPTTVDGKDVADGRGESTGRSTSSTGIPVARELHIAQAGEHDDNEEYQYYLNFLLEQQQGMIKSFPGAMDLAQKVAQRNIIAVYDKNNLPLWGAKVSIGKESYETYQDGEVFIYPDKFEVQGKEEKVTVEYDGKKQTVSILPQKFGRFVVNMDFQRPDRQAIPVDIVFLMDTTGSMGDEIAMLRDTLYSIYMRISKLTKDNNVKLRFGMVLYRDQGDEYVTRRFNLTADVDKFYEFLMKVDAGGGGDYPEDLVSGLGEAMKLNWSDEAVKLVFMITDAPAHVKNYKIVDDLTKTAVQKKIKLFSIGASGLDAEGEIQLRMLAQMTKGKFIFMTYGETGESSGSGTKSDPGKVSHHTGENYASRNLDDIVVDNVQREVYYQFPQKTLLTLKQSYDFKGSEDVVYRRVDNVIQQLKKQSDFKTEKTVLILPPDTEDKSLDSLAMHVSTISEEIIIKEKYLKVVDRSKMDKIIEEMKLKLSGLVDGEDIRGIAKADTILTGKLYFVGNQSVLFVRLIDAESSEVIAAAMVKM